MDNFKDRKMVTLCKDCSECPTLERQEHEVIIRDDFQGKVVLTGSQWDLLVQLVEQKHFADWTFESTSKNK